MCVHRVHTLLKLKRTHTIVIYVIFAIHRTLQFSATQCVKSLLYCIPFYNTGYGSRGRVIC